MVAGPGWERNFCQRYKQAMAKRIRPGDVLEVALEDGLGYVHFVGKHPQYGDGIRVSTAVLKSRPTVAEELFKDAYFTFYPAGAAVAQGLVTVVGNLPPTPLPSVMRRRGAMSGRKVVTWIIQNAAGETLKWSLSQEERLLPIVGIWNHAFLVERISEGWRPEMDAEAGGEPDAIRELLPASKSGQPLVLVHYLYFPRERRARSAALELNRRDFHTTVRPAATGEEWLVLAKRAIEATGQSIAGTRDLMESVARLGKGKYDGWETEVEH